jgi:hypothetical protein
VTSPDESYPGGCVDWSRFAVPALAGFLDEDLGPGWAQVTAWWHAHDLTVEHLGVMRQARAAVVAAWPPSVNQAAAAYVDQLDGLLASMENMRVAAEANARALSGILTVLTQARNTVDELHEQWKQQPSTWETTALTVASVLSGNGQNVADVQALNIHRASLNTQAQAVMRAADQSAYEYLPQLVVVPPRQSSGVFSGPSAPSDDSGSHGGSPRPTRGPAIPLAKPPADVAPSPQGGQPLLSGGGTVGGGTSIDTGSAHTAPGSDTVPGPADRSSVSGPWVQTAVGRVLRSGAVLGAPPEVEARSSVGTRAAGNTESADRPLANSVETEAPLWGIGAGAGRQASRQYHRTMPADTEWHVARGVPPVLEPGPEPVHDPGPGVIGIDR